MDHKHASHARPQAKQSWSSGSIADPLEASWTTSLATALASWSPHRTPLPAPRPPLTAIDAREMMRMDVGLGRAMQTARYAVLARELVTAHRPTWQPLSITATYRPRSLLMETPRSISAIPTDKHRIQQAAIAARCRPDHMSTTPAAITRARMQLDAAVRRVAQPVMEMRHRMRSLHPRTTAMPWTPKGSALIVPLGMDITSEVMGEQCLAVGALLHARGTRVEPVRRLVIALKDGETPTTQYLAFLARRVAIAIGRDPDRHIVAMAHLPERHPSPGADGAPIHAHVHILIAVFDPISGERWRCPHMDVIAQRELAAINRERGIDQVMAPGIAGKRRLGILSEHARLTCILEAVDGTRRPMDLDGPDRIRLKASEMPPSTIHTEPAAGMVVAQRSISSESVKTLNSPQVQRGLGAALDAMHALREGGAAETSHTAPPPADRRACIRDLAIQIRCGRERSRALAARALWLAMQQHQLAIQLMQSAIVEVTDTVAAEMVYTRG